MESKTLINKKINVTSLYFKNSFGLRIFPRRIELEGREYSFIESGLAYRIKKPRGSLQIYDMSDGESSYRLQFDVDHASWKLISITSPKGNIKNGKSNFN
ncbi:MAG TPA: hypothetical protein VMR34_02615 [Candidatus Saccharimonadales bacterium]|nr:hypothetical protein [Candidatus Saccharimonadales bacterium]